MALTPTAGFPYYINLLGEVKLQAAFKATESFEWLGAISEEKSTYAYAAGKWSIKQVVGHMIDHERIMSYRALRISRKDLTPLPGYDQNVLVANARFNQVSYVDLLQDYKNVRTTTISFINMLSEEQLDLKGVVSDVEIAVEDILKATLGHELHHMRVLQEKYTAIWHT